MFNLGDKMDRAKANNLSPIVLAFVGDAVYSLFIREKLTFQAEYKPNVLNKLAVDEVKASAQAEFVNEVKELFNEEELSIFRRGRNAKKTSRAKSARAVDYNSSTGFEAVLGFLYLIGDIDRLNFILNKGNK